LVDRICQLDTAKLPLQRARKYNQVYVMKRLKYQQSVWVTRYRRSLIQDLPVHCKE